MSPLRLILLAALALGQLAGQLAGRLAASDDDFPMRWRTYCDARSVDSFRYPYEYMPVDQYKGDLRRFAGGHGQQQPEFIEVKPDGDSDPLAAQGIDIHHFAYTEEELTAKGLSSLDAIGDAEAGTKLAWKPYNYYQSAPTRPFADPRWADEGIEAMIGGGSDRCALAVRHGAHVSGLVLRGDPASGDNKRILDSYEVLSLGHRMRKDEKLPKKPRWTDWAAAHSFYKDKVIDKDGHVVVAAQRCPSVSWPEAWEIETEHYHITTDFNPSRLLGHGAYVEGLFDAYSKVYRPDGFPPYKFEVHIYSTYREFQEASASWHNAIPVGAGQIVGGFFQPDLLSLWVYEESGKLGGEEFSIEHVMAHECSHQFLHVMCNGSDHIPTWINEGLAVYFENGKFEDGRFVIRPPNDRIMRLQGLYNQEGHTLVPLDKYLDHHGFISADMYGEVYAMTMFWVFATCTPDFAHCKHTNCGYKRFLEFMTALRNKEDGNTAFQRIFMEDLRKRFGSEKAAVDAWSKALMQYVKDGLKMR